MSVVAFEEMLLIMVVDRDKLLCIYLHQYIICMFVISCFVLFVLMRKLFSKLDANSTKFKQVSSLESAKINLNHKSKYAFKKIKQNKNKQTNKNMPDC